MGRVIWRLTAAENKSIKIVESDMMSMNQPSSSVSGSPALKGNERARAKKPKPPYLGSIRFFKHVITIFVIVMMILPWVVMWLRPPTVITQGGEIHVPDTQALARRDAEWEETLKTTVALYEEQLAQRESDLSDILVKLDSKSADLEKALTMYDFQSPYSHLHPELKVEPPLEYADKEKMVYLTFDDGPSRYTRSILDVLKKYEIKATFFVIGSSITGSEDILKRIAEEGHNIGVHSHSHVYKEIYSSVDAFLDDFALVSAKIQEITGIKPNIFRFPGGSLNPYNERWGNTIISEMLSRGYRYYDWNVGSGDASTDMDYDDIYNAVIKQVASYPYSVVLMHDGGGNRSSTVTALRLIIEKLQSKGHTFDMLTNQVRPTVFSTAGYERG